jgi:hypothetical protein
MKKLILIIGLISLTNFTSFSQVKNFHLTDSTTLFNKVDSLKQDEHTEFFLTMFNVVYNNQEELDLIVDNLGNKIYPEGYVLFSLSHGYYPKTEYINEGLDKKYKETYVYVEKNLLDSNIFILCPSPRFNK